MSESRKIEIDLGGVFFWPFFFAWLALCIGEPDLLDAIIAYVQKGCTP